MARVNKDKESLRFSGRRHTKLGIGSAVMGILALVGFVVVSIISASYKGDGNMALGIGGISIFALAILGFVTSFKAFKERDIFYRFPIIGAILNGLMIIVLFVLYILGLL